MIISLKPFHSSGQHGTKIPSVVPSVPFWCHGNLRNNFRSTLSKALHPPSLWIFDVSKIRILYVDVGEIERKYLKRILILPLFSVGIRQLF